MSENRDANDDRPYALRMEFLDCMRELLAGDCFRYDRRNGPTCNHCGGSSVFGFHVAGVQHRKGCQLLRAKRLLSAVLPS